MKTVLDNSNIAHTWANKLQENARTSNGNFYFSGDTIYSYGSHFPIAKHCTNSKGIEFVLFTTRSYSMTTTQHKTTVRQAISHKEIIFCFWPVQYAASNNFPQWEKEAKSIADKLTSAKKPEKYISELKQLKCTIERFAEFTESVIPESLISILEVTNKEEYLLLEGERIKREAIAAEKAKKELAIKHEKELAKFLAGEIDRMYTRDGFDYLRIKADKIETSQGVDLTIPYGISVYNKLKEDKLKVGDKVLQFDVNKINGVVAIGCHTFKKSYLLNFGKQLTQISK